MATLMEKDILIEAVAIAIGTMSKKIIRVNHYDFNEDEIKFIDLRAHIYSTSHEKLNFDEIIVEYKKVMAKYKDMPLNQSSQEDYDACIGNL